MKLNKHKLFISLLTWALPMSPEGPTKHPHTFVKFAKVRYFKKESVRKC